MGFSECSEKDTLEYRNLKMAEELTSRLERVIAKEDSTPLTALEQV